MRLLLAALLALGAGCTSKAIYDSAQGLRRDECRKIVDIDEQSRCLEAADRSYEEYRRDHPKGP